MSWRVGLLPGLDETDLYRHFHLDEPWDSEHNLTLLPRMPRIYADQRRVWNQGDYLTPFQVFSGKGTAFEGNGVVVRLGGIPDGASTTLRACRADRMVPWTKPEDIECCPDGPLPEFLEKKQRRDPRFRVLFADGHVQDLRRDMPESLLRALITRDGGESIDLREVER